MYEVQTIQLEKHDLNHFKCGNQSILITHQQAFYRYMAEWIESWDLEAMTSYNWEIGVRGPLDTSRLEFFHPGFTPMVFLTK